MFDIGGSEFLLLVILGLLVFGPRRLPQMGRQLGGFVAQMRRAMNDFKGTLEREVALDEVKEAAKQVQGITTDARQMTRDLMDVGPPPPADPTRRLRAQGEAVSRGAVDASDPGPPAEKTAAEPAPVPATEPAADPPEPKSEDPA